MGKELTLTRKGCIMEWADIIWTEVLPAQSWSNTYSILYVCHVYTQIFQCIIIALTFSHAQSHELVGDALSWKFLNLFKQQSQ